MFNQQDIALIGSKGIDLKKIEKEIRYFRSGFPFIRLAKPATINDGIFSLTESIKNSYINLFEESVDDLDLVKLVPSSGAASRMFKLLFEFRNSYSETRVTLRKFSEDRSFNSVFYLFNHLQEIAFYPTLSSIIRKTGEETEDLIRKDEHGRIADFILNPAGLNYSNLPKALIEFHLYKEEVRTAAEEHLVEAASYARGKGGEAKIHFTISPEHRERFILLFSEVVARYEKRYNVRLGITYSIQKPSTDTIAVDESNEPFRDSEGSLLFRPGGHGALLSNLNEIDADLIFIKNIDNVVPDRLKEQTFLHKKMIGGYLLHLKGRIHEYLRKLDTGRETAVMIEEMVSFAGVDLNVHMPAGFDTWVPEKKAAALRSKLNRPIRVCGMVKNEGEPGGGPFWTLDAEGNPSLQIVESAQIDFTDQGQKEIFSQSTHFNPVDIVCCTKDYKGQVFDLQNYVDENTGLISYKSSGGRTLKAQELPGLWNGAMSDWITVFTEVPIITFNPVKTVNDLLRKEHLTE